MAIATERVDSLHGLESQAFLAAMEALKGYFDAAGLDPVAEFPRYRPHLDAAIAKKVHPGSRHLSRYSRIVERKFAELLRVTYVPALPEKTAVGKESKRKDVAPLPGTAPDAAVAAAPAPAALPVAPPAPSAPKVNWLTKGDVTRSTTVLHAALYDVKDKFAEKYAKSTLLYQAEKYTIKDRSYIVLGSTRSKVWKDGVREHTFCGLRDGNMVAHLGAEDMALGDNGQPITGSTDYNGAAYFSRFAILSKETAGKIFEFYSVSETQDAKRKRESHKTMLIRLDPEAELGFVIVTEADVEPKPPADF